MSVREHYHLDWTKSFGSAEVATWCQNKTGFFPDGPLFFEADVLEVNFEKFIKELTDSFPALNIIEYKEMSIMLIDHEAYGGRFNMYIQLERGTGERSYDQIYLLVEHADCHAVVLLDKFSDSKLNEHDFDTEYYFISEKGLQNYTITKNTKDLDYIIEDIYPGLDAAKLYTSFMESKETILILLGKPGVGKTTLIKYFMRELSTDVYNSDYGIPSKRKKPRAVAQADHGDTLFAYAKGNDVLSKEQFWAGLTSSDTRMLILDDLDFSLLPRDSDGNEFMSNFLSFTDGIFDNNIKVVLTTNVNYSQIDPAALRAGRCFDILDLQPLNYDQALELWTSKLDQDIETFNDKFGKDEFVYQSELMAHLERINNENINLDYLTDINISVRHSYNKQRKVGF